VKGEKSLGYSPPQRKKKPRKKQIPPGKGKGPTLPGKEKESLATLKKSPQEGETPTDSETQKGDYLKVPQRRPEKRLQFSKGETNGLLEESFVKVAKKKP